METKRGGMILSLSLVFVLSLSIVSALSFSDYWNKVTGNVISSKACSDGEGIGSLSIGNNKELCASYQGQNQILRCWDDDDDYSDVATDPYNNPNLGLELNGWKCERWGWFCNSKASPNGEYCCSGELSQTACASGGGGGGSAVPICTDSDGGRNITVKGTVSGPQGSITSLTRIDVCEAQTQVEGNYWGVVASCSGDKCSVTEGYCDENNEVYLEAILCPNGCSDGACIPASSPTKKSFCKGNICTLYEGESVTYGSDAIKINWMDNNEVVLTISNTRIPASGKLVTGGSYAVGAGVLKIKEINKLEVSSEVGNVVFEIIEGESNCKDDVCTLYEGDDIIIDGKKVVINWMDSDEVIFTIDGSRVPASGKITKGVSAKLNENSVIRVINIGKLEVSGSVGSVTFEVVYSTTTTESKCEGNSCIIYEKIGGYDSNDLLVVEDVMQGEKYTLRFKISEDTTNARNETTIEKKTSEGWVTICEDKTDGDGCYIGNVVLKINEVSYSSGGDEYVKFEVVWGEVIGIGKDLTRCVDVCVITEGQNLVVANHLVSINWMDSDEVVFNIDNDRIPLGGKMAVGDSYRLSDESILSVDEISKLEIEGEIGMVRFKIGEPICEPNWVCNSEPAICPAHGKQTVTCIDYNNCGETSYTSISDCTPDECSGCLIPKWLGWDYDKKCIPYGFRFDYEIGGYNQEIRDFEEEERMYDEIEREYRLYIESNEKAVLVFYDGEGEAYPDNYTLVSGQETEVILPWFDESINKFIVYTKEIHYSPRQETLIDGRFYSESWVDVIVKGTEKVNVPITINAYCELDGTVYQQKTKGPTGRWANCQNNYECESNVCSSGECIEVTTLMQEASAFKRAMVGLWCFIAHPLSDDNRNLCKAELLGAGK